MIRLKKLLLLFAINSLSFACYAQASFEKWYGTTGSESAWSLAVTDDGGYITSGYTNPLGSSDSNLYVVRVAANGDLMWTKSIGGAGNEVGNYIIKTTDGNYVIAGSTSTNSIGLQDFLLMKIDTSGNVIWSKNYGRTGADVARSVCQTADGGFVIAGYSYSAAPNNLDGYLVKTDANGTQIWAKAIGGNGDDHFYSIKLLKSGGYILTGGTSSIGNGDLDVYMVKTDAAGSITWQKSYGGVYFDEGKYVELASDGTYIVAGITDLSYGNDDAYAMKTDTNGVVIWSHSFGGTEKDLARSIENTSDGGYVIGAITRSFGLISPNMWLIKTDASGAKQWDNTFGGSKHEHCYMAKQTQDGGYILCGHTESYGAGQLDVYLVKTNPTGTLGINELTIASDFNIFPNPASHFVTVSFNAETPGNYSFRLTNTMGKVVYQASEFMQGENSSKTISIENIATSGIYFLEIKTEGFTKYERIVLVK